MKNVVILLQVDTGEMTAKQFQQAVKAIRGYAKEVLLCEGGGELLGLTERPTYLPKEKKATR